MPGVEIGDEAATGAAKPAWRGALSATWVTFTPASAALAANRAHQPAFSFSMIASDTS